MAVQVPEERVYYYECSAGRFRLVAFFPRAELESMMADVPERARALRDFPDGLDLDCTEADFDEFARTYGFRLPHRAEELRAAFLAILSSTGDWRRFRGSGFLPAADLETCLGAASRALEDAGAYEESASVTRDLAAPPEPGLRSRSPRPAVRRAQAALESLEVEGVDPNKSLREQSFQQIKMSGGEPAPEFFAKVHRQGSQR